MKGEVRIKTDVSGDEEKLSDEYMYVCERSVLFQRLSDTTVPGVSQSSQLKSNPSRLRSKQRFEDAYIS